MKTQELKRPAGLEKVRALLGDATGEVKIN